ncbi:MAG TPA: glycosyltransferase [Casimicrobiaceae bacterium]|nr:glycosyltransferase [Casimicrobiaceae bacterium]
MHAKLTIVVPCKARLEYLKRSLPTFVTQPESEVVVVDYDCPDGTRDWVAANFPRARVVAVNDAPFFNLSRARNVGAREARADWIVFCDADNLLAPSFATELFARVSPGAYLRTLRETPRGTRTHNVPLACEATTFWFLGGYDDAFQGWGVEDREFVDRLDRSGIREVVGPANLVDTLRHGNAERSGFYEHRIEVSMAINNYYCTIKQRYFETTGRWFSDAQRHSTYDKVAQAVLTSLGDRESDSTFDIAVVGSNPPWAARLDARSIRAFRDTKCERLARLAQMSAEGA